jgi:NAD(P)-dependent dehydrogenase (short-subunit alcohol dehydrogenase family)
MIDDLAFRLDGHRVLMTGALGILGGHCCEALANAGAEVIVTDLDGDNCRQRAAEISSDTGMAATGFRVDVSDEASVAALHDALADRDIVPDVLINAAATKSDNFFAPLHQFPLEDWNHVMSVNVSGMFLMLRAFLPAMAARGNGTVINFGSIYGLLGPDPRIYEGAVYEAMGGQINTPLVYSASKGAVVAITRHVATVYGGTGIRANTLVPGGIESGQNETFIRNYAARVPLARMGEPSDIARTLVWLASPASAYVNGQTVVVDGGLSAW